MALGQIVVEFLSVREHLLCSVLQTMRNSGGSS